MHDANKGYRSCQWGKCKHRQQRKQYSLTASWRHAVLFHNLITDLGQGIWSQPGITVISLALTGNIKYLLKIWPTIFFLKNFYMTTTDNQIYYTHTKHRPLHWTAEWHKSWCTDFSKIWSSHWKASTAEQVAGRTGRRHRGSKQLPTVNPISLLSSSSDTTATLSI